MATLVLASWLLRTWRVAHGGRDVVVTYNGRGIGSEAVLVDGVAAIRKTSVVWFAPEFTFVLGGVPCMLQVAVNAFLQLSWARLTVDGAVAYEEGNPPARLTAAPLVFYTCAFAALGSMTLLLWLLHNLLGRRLAAM